MFGVPLEYLMFGGIGFCLAWLTALMVLPAVHNRAVRLARERYDDLPLSMQEIRAEKDTIRAGFAAATRELELRIEKLRDKTVAHTTDLAKKHQLVERLKQEVDMVTAALRASETREQAARDALREAKRGFADKDVTLGTAEGEITALKRDLAAKETALRAADKELATIRGELSGKQAALHTADAEVASLGARLRESEQREQTARTELRDTRRDVADKGATLGTVEGEMAKLQRELDARDTALRAGERDLEAVRSELAGKDAALNHAEKEIAAIRAEIAALTKLLVQVDTNSGYRTERVVPSERRVEIVPFVPASRTATQSQQEHARPQPIQQQAEAKAPRPQAAPEPARQEDPSSAPRAPIDLVAAPTRLIPPTIPQGSQHGSDTVGHAMTEITDAARRIDERDVGPNQRLRAAYAPFVKGSN